MANLFEKQADLYARARPTYTDELFQFIASKTPKHDLAWDVGTGSGQAAVQLSRFYHKVIATDASEEQLAQAPPMPNVEYRRTPPAMSVTDLRRYVAAEGSVDLVTVAQALHWFAYSDFYEQVNCVLRRPGGVVAAWCYTIPRVDDSVDPVLSRLYADSAPFWAPERGMVDEEYRTVPFPFEPVHGADHTGPFRFEAVSRMDLSGYLMYVRSWSAYQTAMDGGVELLGRERIAEFERAWGGDEKSPRLVRFPIHLRIGRV